MCTLVVYGQRCWWPFLCGPHVLYAIVSAVGGKCYSVIYWAVYTLFFHFFQLEIDTVICKTKKISELSNQKCWTQQMSVSSVGKSLLTK